MTYNASERKDIRKAEKAAAISLANRIAYTREIMSTLPGREWMHSLLVRCNIFHEPFVVGAADATAFNCGQANIGRQIFNDIFTHCPDLYVLMMQEQSAKEATDGRRSAEPIDDTGPELTAEDGYGGDQGPAGEAADRFEIPGADIYARAEAGTKAH